MSHGGCCTRSQSCSSRPSCCSRSCARRSTRPPISGRRRPGLSFIALAMPPFWFGLLLIQFLGADLKSALNLQEPVFYSIGLHKGGVSGINLDYVRHLVLPVMTLTVQIVAGWGRYQRAAMLD